MAKGKEAVAAARRRYEASIEHIDRLTSELTEAKVRAKMSETDAAKVPHLQQQLLELRQRLDAESRRPTAASARSQG